MSGATSGAFTAAISNSDKCRVCCSRDLFSSIASVRGTCDIRVLQSRTCAREQHHERKLAG